VARTSIHNVVPVLKAAGEWRDRCFVGDGSVLSDRSLWTTGNLAELRKYFVESPIEGTSENFFEKLEQQLTPASPETRQLAAEMMWVMFLFPSNVTHKKKREGVTRIWAWSGNQLNDETPNLLGPLSEGVGSGGIGFNNYRWRELALFIEVAERFKAQPSGERLKLLSDPWKFGNWLDAVPNAEKRQLRHMLLFLLFPDYFETISSGTHKNDLLKAFQDQIQPDTLEKNLSPSDSNWIKIDKRLLNVREVLQAGVDTPINFYIRPWRGRWRPEEDEGTKGDIAVEGTSPKKRAWIEKSLVRGRPDREEGAHALGKALWSPKASTDGADIYSNMREVRPGDVVFHLTDNEAIKGVSVVSGIREDDFVGVSGTPWGGVACYRVPLKEFVTLQPPLPRASFFAAPFQERLREGLKAHHKMFYSSTLELNQGAYLTEAPPFLISIFQEAYALLSKTPLPHIVNTESSTAPCPPPPPHPAPWGV